MHQNTTKSFFYSFHFLVLQSDKNNYYWNKNIISDCNKTEREEYRNNMTIIFINIIFDKKTI